MGFKSSFLYAGRCHLSDIIPLSTMETPRIINSRVEKEWVAFNKKQLVLKNETLVTAEYESPSEYRQPYYNLEWKSGASVEDIVEGLEVLISHYESEGGESVEKTTSYMKQTYSTKNNSIFSEAEIVLKDLVTRETVGYKRPFSNEQLSNWINDGVDVISYQTRIGELIYYPRRRIFRLSTYADLDPDKISEFVERTSDGKISKENAKPFISEVVSDLLPKNK